MPIRYNPDLRPLITDWLTPDEGEEMYLAKVQTRLLIEGLEAEVEHLQGERQSQARHLKFLDTPGDEKDGYDCDHERRYLKNRQDEEGDYYDECQVCRVEKAEAEVEHLRAIIRNFLNAEEVLTRPVFREAPGPPFDTWIALQNRNEALDVLRTEAAKGGKP